MTLGDANTGNIIFSGWKCRHRDDDGAGAKLDVFGHGNNTSNGIKITELATTGTRGTYLDFINTNNGNADSAGSMRFMLVHNNVNVGTGLILLTGTTGHQEF